MRITSLPSESLLKCMSAADRKALGRAGLTKADCEELAQAKNERELQKQIVGWLGTLDAEVFFSRTDKRTTNRKGTPDLMFCLKFKSWGRTYVVAFAWEVKFGNGKLSPEQELLAKRLTAPPNGWRFAVIRSLKQAKEELEKVGFLGTGE